MKDAVKKARAVFVRKAQQLRDAKNTAYRMLKKRPVDDPLRASYAAAEQSLLEFEAGRKAAEAKATREAREKTLK